MSNLFWLSEARMERLQSHFPKPHGRPRVDDPLTSGDACIAESGLC